MRDQALELQQLGTLPRIHNVARFAQALDPLSPNESDRRTLGVLWKQIFIERVWPIKNVDYVLGKSNALGLRQCEHLIDAVIHFA